MNSIRPRPFETPGQLGAWLEANHQAERELWVRIFKKSSGTPTVTWNDCVVAALAWGWIDGQRKSLDAVSFLQRLTPRRPRSDWSKRNCEHAERLIAGGLMRPPGLAQVRAARADGRWERAYAGSAGMILPDDFLKAVRSDRAAEQSFEGLDRRDVYAIYRCIQAAKRLKTRNKRIADIVERLARGAERSARRNRQGLSNSV